MIIANNYSSRKYPLRINKRNMNSSFQASTTCSPWFCDLF